MTDENYTFERLNASSIKPFRLLHLQPRYGADVEITLAETSLESGVRYEALSYTWGSSDEPCFVRCNGSPLQVTRNCKVALQHLRATEPRVLWVDAICIDQSNIPERNQQVTMMQEIYEKAVRVVVWLGEPTPELQLGMHAIRVFAKLLSENENVLPEHDGCKQMMEMKSMKESLSCLAGAAWWRRIWVVQEIHAAESATVRCGDIEVPWSAFETFSLWVAKTGVSRFPYHIGLVAQRILLMITFKGRKSSLPSLLAAFENQEATDPRDKLFALNGLMHEASKVEVNYSLSVEEVFIMAAQKSLEVGGSFDALRPWDFSGYEDDRTGLLDTLPSWARDVSIRRISNKIDICPNFSASRGSKPQYTVEGRVLKIRCKIVDHISLCGAMMQREPRFFYPALQEWREVIFSLDRYPNGEDLFDVFWQLISLLSIVQPISDYDDLSLKSTRFIFREWLKLIGSKGPSEADAAVRQDQKALLFQNKLELPIGLSICTTEKSFVGAAPPLALPGDLIAIPTGSSKPYVLREAGNQTFRIVGPCYIHGIMRGEGWAGDVEREGSRAATDLHEISIV